jgi:hypothetical protein
MSLSRPTRVPIALLTTAACLTLIPTLAAQSVDATSLVSQMSLAFSKGIPITGAQLTGTATWHAGSTQDSGPVTLTASASGAATMSISLAKKGNWSESQTQFGSGMACQWNGRDAVAHEGDMMNCLRPVVWFLPSISLQASSISPGLGVEDLGAATVNGATSHKLQAQAVLAGIPNRLLSDSVTASTTEVDLDPNTLLPTTLRYSIHPDDGSAANVPIEVRFSDYQKAGGAVLPFHIQRFVNGSLQLDIQVSSAQIS